jgi:hypothetical protein
LIHLEGGLDEELDGGIEALHSDFPGRVLVDFGFPTFGHAESAAVGFLPAVDDVPHSLPIKREEGGLDEGLEERHEQFNS